MSRLLGNTLKGLLFVVSAPAGTGKSTLVNRLISEFPDSIQEACSMTTRNPRHGEVNGQHYHFVKKEEFEKKQEEGAFLETAYVFGNWYGTLNSEVDSILESGKHAILVIDTQGAAQIRKHKKGVFIFMSPPSLEELKGRLFKRQTEDAQEQKERLQWAQKELQQVVNYHYHIVNDDLEIAYQVMKSIIIAEEHRNH